jgi:hypothetical protein
MYKVLDKTSESVLVKMDISTFENISKDINENIDDYEFVFEEPIKASKLNNS